MFMLGEHLGDYGPAYVSWSNQVRALGGRVTVMPLRDAAGRPLSGPSPVAAAYPMTVWAVKANARQWALPDAYSTDGKTGFYRAPKAVQDAAKDVAKATEREGASAGKQLEAKWWDAIFSAPRNAISKVLGIPPWLVTAAIGVGGFFLVKQLLPVFGDAARSRLVRSNPRGRRRRRRSSRR